MKNIFYLLVFLAILNVVLYSGDSCFLKPKSYSDLDALRIEIFLANTEIFTGKYGSVCVLPKSSFSYRLFETTDPGCYEALGRESSLYVAEGKWHALTQAQKYEIIDRDIKRVNYHIVSKIGSGNDSIRDNVFSKIVKKWKLY